MAFFKFRPRKKFLKTFRQHQLQKAAEIFKYFKVSLKIALEEKRLYYGDGLTLKVSSLIIVNAPCYSR